MKSPTTVTLLIALSCNLLIAQVPEFEWVTGPGGTGSVSYPNIAADPSGNIIISANFSGSISFGATILTSTPGEICIVKYNSSGEVLWARQEGASDNQSVYGTDTDQAGNIYITGFFDASITFGDITLGPNGGFFLAKLDPSGNVLWAKQSTGGNVTAKHIKTDASGNAYIAGGFVGTPTFDDITLTDDGGVFIAKYDPSGIAVWVEQCHGNGNGQAYGLDVDDAGNSIITGVFDETIDWGTTSLTSDVGTDMFITKYNSSGTLQWAKQIGVEDDAWGSAAAFDNSGNCYFLGDFEESASFDGTIINAVGSWDSFISKYNSNGTFLWVRSVEGSGEDHGWDIDIDPYNNAIYTGCFKNTALFGSTSLTSRSADQYDIFISAYDESGNHLWAKRAGSSEEDQGRGMIINNQGRVFNTGWIKNGGTADFDTHELSTSGIFLSLLEENYLTVTPSSREVEYTSGSTTFSVDANVAWSASKTSSWINISKNGDNIDVDYFANPDPAERTATITVIGDGCSEQVTVVQDPAPCQITLIPTSIEVGYASGRTNVSVDANVTWTVSDTSSWLNSTKNGDEIVIDYFANPVPVERTAIITITGDGCSEQLTVVQDPAPCLLSVTPENLTVSHNDSTVKLVIASNADWSFSKNEDWLNATETHSDTLKIDYDANESVERSATIEVSNTCLKTRDVNITQEERPVFIDNFLEKDHLSVYPNPTSDIIYLKSELDIDAELTVTIYDNTGRMVYSQYYEKINNFSPLKIDIAELERGIYLLQISTSHASSSTVVIKE